MILWWSGPGVGKQLIDEKNLYTKVLSKENSTDDPKDSKRDPATEKS